MSELVGADWNLSAQKRAFDMIGLTAMMPVLAPIGAASAGVIKLVDDMDPLYASTRYGIGGEPFTCYKLRTMPEGTPETPSSGSATDVRATPLGKMLRKTHFDEIPQAINIYKNEMSLVGPRQLIAEDMAKTLDVLSPAEQKDWLWARATAKPAPFGPFQLSQHNNQYRAHSEGVAYRRAISDIEYARTATLRGDLAIVRDSIKDGIGSFIFRPEAGERLRGQRGAKLLLAVAEHLGVEVKPHETTYWQSAFMLARTIDDLVDDKSGVDIEAALKDALSGKPIGSMNGLEAMNLSNAYGQLSAERRQAWLVACLALPDFQQAKAHATAPKQLVRICKTESALFARMLELDIEQSDMSARQNFNKWVHSFSDAAYMADTVVDLKRDYRNGATKVAPTAYNRLTLAFNGVDEGFRSMELTPFRTYRALTGIALRGLFF